MIRTNLASGLGVWASFVIIVAVAGPVVLTLAGIVALYRNGGER